MEEESLKWRCWKELKRVCDVVFENNNLKVAIDKELEMLKTLEKGLWVGCLQYEASAGEWLDPK